MALDGSGKPIDSDGDGIADVLEDANGNGVFDGSDLANFTLSDTDGDGVSDGAEVRMGRNPRQGTNAADASGALRLQVFTPSR